MNKFLSCLADTFSAVFLFIGFLTFLALLYTKSVWGDVYVEQIVSAAVNDFDTIGSGIVSNYIYYVFIPACVLTVLCMATPIKNLWFNLAAICMICYGIWEIKLYEYIVNQNVYSELYEQEYVDPKNLEFTFPADKRNLILLYLESIEEDYADATVSGTNLLPNLSLYSQTEMHFPNFIQMPSQDYTIAAVVSSMCGVPLRLPKKLKLKDVRFLPHIECFPQVLAQNGYENYVFRSTDLNFAGARNFYELHGVQHIKDKLDLEKEIDFEKNKGTSWGYNDRIYYELAKKELLKVAEQNKPFMFVMETVDTHTPDIYLDKQCPKKFNNKRDIIMCADSMAAEFLNWLKQQDFYENTTVVVVGDHPETGKNDIYPNHKNRKIVNFILNPAENSAAKPHEVWSTVDIAPTALNALGIEFENGKFGLGRSLLQDTPTLYEKYHDRLSNEILKSSHVYDSFYDDLPD